MQSIGIGQQHGALAGVRAEMQGSNTFFINDFYDAFVIMALVHNQTVIFIHAIRRMVKSAYFP
jgi:hypothetical protein